MFRRARLAPAVNEPGPVHLPMPCPDARGDRRDHRGSMPGRSDDRGTPTRARPVSSPVQADDADGEGTICPGGALTDTLQALTGATDAVEAFLEAARDDLVEARTALGLPSQHLTPRFRPHGRSHHLRLVPSGAR